MARVALLILAILIPASSGEAGDKGVLEILIEKKVEVAGDSIMLGDIARIKSDAGDVRMLRSLRLGKAPSPGSYRFLSRRRLEAHLAKNGWEDAKVTSPEKIEVWRTGVPLSEGRLEHEVRKAISERMPWSEEMAEIKVKVPRNLPVMPKGSVEFNVVLPRKYDFIGRESLLVKLSVDGMELKKLWVKTEVKVFSDMVTASRPILRNEILREGDLKVERRALSSISRGMFSKASEIFGMRAKRAIKKGSLIMEGDIALPTIIKRGSVVTIVAEKGPLAISTRGKAMERGHVGKFIRVENISSRKVILAEVVDPKTVKVDL